MKLLKEWWSVFLLVVILAGGVFDYVNHGDRRDRLKPVIGTPING